jgi:hypothetical protein
MHMIPLFYFTIKHKSKSCTIFLEFSTQIVEFSTQIVKYRAVNWAKLDGDNPLTTNVLDLLCVTKLYICDFVHMSHEV